MANKKQIDEAAKAIHGYELSRGYITREWNGAQAEPVYCEIAKAALEAAEPFREAHKTHN
jgi:hypothetical protein